MLEVINLECTRGDRALFHSLSFSLTPGEILHVRGANGCGKTTLLRAVCGLTAPSAGEVRWQGQAITHSRDDYYAALRYVGHHDGVQGELTATENLRAYAGLHGGAIATAPPIARPAIAAALAALELPTSAVAAKFLSQGQRRRLALARLALDSRALWILDEPLTALDRATVTRLLEMFAQHSARGGMILLTSHQELDLDGVSELELAS